MRKVYPQPVRAFVEGDWLGNMSRNPLGFCNANDWHWPNGIGCSIVSCKPHGPEIWKHKNKPLRGDWWPVLIDGIWYWDRRKIETITVIGEYKGKEIYSKTIEFNTGTVELT